MRSFFLWWLPHELDIAAGNQAPLRLQLGDYVLSSLGRLALVKELAVRLLLFIVLMIGRLEVVGRTSCFVQYVEFVGFLCLMTNFQELLDLEDVLHVATTLLRFLETRQEVAELGTQVAHFLGLYRRLIIFVRLNFSRVRHHLERCSQAGVRKSNVVSVGAFPERRSTLSTGKVGGQAQERPVAWSPLRVEPFEVVLHVLDLARRRIKLLLTVVYLERVKDENAPLLDTVTISFENIEFLEVKC